MREKSDSMSSLTKKAEVHKVQKGGGAHSSSPHKARAAVHVVELAPQSNVVLPVQTSNMQTPNKAKGKSFSKHLNKGGGAQVATALLRW